MTTDSFRRALLHLLLVAVAIPLAAHAGDGRIEISHVDALAGGITPGDAPGYPVELTETGSYVMTSNLTVPADTVGVLVTAEDVTVDLNGFVVQGPVVCSGTPPTCPAGSGQGVLSTARGTVLHGGTVAGFADGGIQLGDLSSAYALLVRDNGRVGIQVGDRAHVEQVRVSANDGDGIVTGADGIVVRSDVVGNSGVGTALGVGTGSASNVINENGSVSTGGLLLSDNVCERGLVCSSQCTDGDLDGAFADCVPLDCDDGEPLAFPGNAEVCDGIDNDCDDLVDEGGICAATCGDGSTEGSEVCDDGNTASCGTCNATCSATNTLAVATGTITAVASTSLIDGEIFVLGDGLNPATTFEFDTVGDGGGAGNEVVVVTGSLGAGQVRDAIIGSVNVSALAISAFPGGVDVVALENQVEGTQGNVPIFDGVADPGFAVTGMSGGTGTLCAAGVGCVSGADCLSGSCSAGLCD